MDSDHRAVAVGALAEREYERAGDEYSRAGWDRLAEPREGRSPFDPDEKGWVGRALQRLVLAGVCYRVAGLDDRASARAREGVAVARDLRNALVEPAQRACLLEFAADFRVAGGLEGVGEAYDDARVAYEDAADTVESVDALTTTPLFQGAAGALRQVARGLENGEVAVSWHDLHGPDPADVGRFLAHRVRFKRQRFPSLLDRAVEAGYLAAPRGTTEYDNASFRCPDCGSTDVNWVTDHTLCLRCSTPMAER
ncbi:hypothetical protein NDI56_15175 [Haloarcula sp. S1CR25-12]|uniref:Uncharacterized protein n=1 Tax=Haloarcula saliterrae TaxID=2950534 RepID=A0ABU2FFM6_9EURY|nr:hypothetical protein [Haloarcula sp. S1CR25-12]MDS0260748.1 hypothetical protein [Haloarcula sp. S1CR25-12]